MKHSSCAVVLLSFVLCTACEQQEPKVEEETAVTSGDVKKEMGEAVSKTVEFSRQEMDEYRDRVQAKIAELEKDIAALKAKVEKKSADVNADMREAIENLEDKTDTLKGKAKKLKTAGAEAWGELKSGIDDAIEDLERAYEQAQDKFEA